MKKKILRNSIFFKLIASFILGSIVLCAIYLYFYATSMNLLKEERITAVDTAGKDYLQTLDRQLANVKRSIYISFSMQDWNELATSTGTVDDYRILQQVIIAKERIRAIASTSEIVEEVSVHFPKWGRTISTEDGLKEYNINKWNNIAMPLESVGAQIVYYEGDAYLTSRYQMANPELFSISAKISYDKYHNLFSDNGLPKTEVSTFLFDINTDRLLLSKTENTENTEITDLLLKKIVTMNFAENSFPIIKIDGNKYVLINNTSSYSGLRIVNTVKVNDLTSPFTMQKQLGVIIMFVISVIILLMFVYINHSFVTPINQIVQAFKPLEKGDFSVRLTTKSNDEFSVLFQSYNHMVENLNKLVNDVYEKDLLIERANFKQLQSQINPHFLYNSFYALSTMIKIGDMENADAFCKHLATYYQYITRSGADMVPLSEELQHAQNYVNIMAMRNAKINVEFTNNLDEDSAVLNVPRLIIQPMIENAFQHGLKAITGSFSLKVTATQSDQQINISVEDNGLCTDEEISQLQAKLQEFQPVKETTGLINIHKRLQIFFGNRSGILVSRSALGGLMVTVNISVEGVPQNDLQNIGSRR